MQPAFPRRAEVTRNTAETRIHASINLDGSGLNQVTTDGGLKTNLRWLPDGQTLAYISGRCIQSIHFLSKATNALG